MGGGLESVLLSTAQYRVAPSHQFMHRTRTMDPQPVLWIPNLSQILMDR